MISNFHRPINIHCISVFSIQCRDIVFIHADRRFQISYQIAGNNIHRGVFNIGIINECNHAHNFIIWKIPTTECHSSAFLCSESEKRIRRIVACNQICCSARFKCGIAIDGWNIWHIFQRISINNDTLIRHQIFAQILRENDTRFEFHNIGNINSKIATLFIDQSTIEIFSCQIHRIVYIKVDI